MSINSALLAGVSGLIANSSALAAISDNIANVNTVGYKRSQVNFSNIVTSQAVQGSYSAGGVQGTVRQYVTQQGLPTRSASATDLAISGQGFFVVTDKAEDLTAADTRSFTRAGSFSVDVNGYLKNDAGLYLQGWPVALDGSVDVDPSNASSLASINVRNIASVVEPTSEVVINANIDSEQPQSAGLAGYNATTASMAAYLDNPATGTRPDFSIPSTVVDSKGGLHEVTISFLKTATPNEWLVEVSSPDVISGTAATGQIAAGTIAFDAAGKLDVANSTAALFTDPANPENLTLSIGASSAGAGVRWAAALGIEAQDLSLGLGGTVGGLSQLSLPSSVQSTQANGAGPGNVSGVQIDGDGFVTAVFDNGLTRKIAQIAIATFPNADGLNQISGNAYRVGLTSGSFSLKPAGIGGAGSISPSSLEASTVDLSSEFTGLITTQRAYSASSKIITTADQMLEELLSIKR